jgi:hypothetical protein
MNAFREQIALLDRALTELGFEYRPGSAQVSWRGRWAGRDCVVRAAPQRRTRYAGEVRYRTTVGFRLRAELETSVRTQLFFVREGFAQNFLVRWLYKWRRRTVVPRVPAALRGFAAVTIDPPWAERVLDEPNAMLAVAQLLTEGATPSLAGSVYFAPTSESGRLYYASPIVGSTRSRVSGRPRSSNGWSGSPSPPPRCSVAWRSWGSAPRSWWRWPSRCPPPRGRWGAERRQ